MSKFLKGFGIFIGVIAIFASLFVLAEIAYTFSNGFKSFPEFTLNSLYVAVPLFVGLVFFIFEFKNVVQLFKLTKENKINKCLKPLAGLVNSIMGVFVSLLMRKLIGDFINAYNTDTILEFKVLIPLVVGLALVFGFINIISTLKRNSYKGIAVFTLFYIILAFLYLSFAGFEVAQNYVQYVTNLVQASILILVAIYMFFGLIYYAKSREEIDEPYYDSKDIKVLKKINKNCEKVRIYQARKGKGSGGVITLLILTILCIVVFIAWSSIDLIKNGSSINLSIIFKSADGIYCFIEAFALLGLLLMIPHILLALIGVFSGNSSLYPTAFILTSVVTYFIANNLKIFITITQKIVDAISAKTFTATALLIYLPYIPLIVGFIIGLFAKKHYENVIDNINEGNSIASCSKDFRLTGVLYSIMSLLMVSSFIATGIIFNFKFCLSTYLFVVAILLSFIASLSYKKHNLEESIVVVRKRQ